MKAYKLSIKDDPDQGEVIVFAKTVKEAKKLYEYLDFDRYIDMRCKRASYFDGMENASRYELSLVQWHEGWHWFDVGVPQPDDDGETTDEDFKEWYDKYLRIEGEDNV